MNIVSLARKALPLMDPESRRETERLLAEMSTENTAAVEAAREAFERDMRPVREAIVKALQAGDVEALRGLRALLPHLLADVNESPELADVLAYELGRSFLSGLNAKPEEVL